MGDPRIRPNYPRHWREEPDSFVFAQGNHRKGHPKEASGHGAAMDHRKPRQHPHGVPRLTGVATEKSVFARPQSQDRPRSPGFPTVRLLCLRRNPRRPPSKRPHQGVDGAVPQPFGRQKTRRQADDHRHRHQNHPDHHREADQLRGRELHRLSRVQIQQE